MKPSDNIEKMFTQTNIETNTDVDKVVLSDAVDAMSKSKQKTPVCDKPSVWRIIMKNRITKFAVAASVLIAIVLSITIFDNAVTPAYAIEQTIEAMRSISSIHTYCTDWDGSQGETWVKINPETGQEEYHYTDQGNLLIVATPQATHYYHKDKNIVRIKKEYIPASSVRISRFFEDLPKWVQEHGGKCEFYTQFDEDLQKEIIIVHFVIPVQEKEVYVRIDSQTKLPINLEAISSKPGQGVKSVDKIEYNVSIPEGLFEFEIPKGAKVVYE
jgi:hypothetical protein